MRGVCVVGVTFAFMGYRNFITTLVTLLEKNNKKKKTMTARKPGRAGRGASSDGRPAPAAAGAGAAAAEGGAAKAGKTQ